MRRTRSQAVSACLLGACPTLTVLLRRTIRDHLRRSRPEKILNVFQRIRLRFFRACGLASGRISFASSRTAMSDRLLAIGLVNVKKKFLVVLATWLPGLSLANVAREGDTAWVTSEGVRRGVSELAACRCGPGWSRRDGGPQPSWCPNRTPGGTGGIPKRSFREHGNEHWSSHE